MRTQGHYRKKPVNVTCITNSHRAQSFRRSPHTIDRTNCMPFMELKTSIDCYFHSSETWHSVTYQKDGILNHTIVKTSKLTLVMVILARCFTPTLSQVNSVHVPLPSNLSAILILLSMMRQLPLRYSDQNFEFVSCVSHGQGRQKLPSFSGLL